MKINIKYIPPEVKKTVSNIDQNSQEVQIPSLSDYTMVAEENLFHPERKIPEEKKEEQPLPKPEFVLYGTLITDDLSMAFLEDLKAPLTSPGRGKRQTVLKKGDNMSGFTLNEIEVDKVVMMRGEVKMMLYVHDPHRPKIRESSLQAPSTTVPSQQTGLRPTRTPSTSTPSVPPKTQRTPSTSTPSSGGPSFPRNPLF